MARRNKDMCSDACDDLVEKIKEIIVNGQYSALQNINKIQLSVYFVIGGYLSEISRGASRGSDIVECISDSLIRKMPGLKSFFETNLKMMRSFYESWSFLDKSSVDLSNANQLFDCNNNEEVSKKIGDLAVIRFDFDKLQKASATFDADTFFSVAFSHHCVILSSVKDLEERCFYINLCANERLSVASLKKAIINDEFHHAGKNVNTFQVTIPNKEYVRRAIMSFKDEYMLDFINAEDFGVRDVADLDEKVVEQEIINNIKNFIMTLGKDFAFLGNQYRIEVAGHSHYIDLLFYNRALSCLVAVELKVGTFKAIYLGQLSSYLAMLDDFVKKPTENPSIGILLCRDVDKTYAEYMVRTTDKPIGVATFKTRDDLPEPLKRILPDLDKLKNLLN